MIDVTLATYEQHIIEASHTTPVLVDFWAPWCTPCKMLGPILEKLEAEYAGRFILAKVNIDDAQQLGAMFGVRSVPTCMLVKDGQVLDGFMGALPEPQLRAFFDKHLGAAGMLAPQADAELQVEDEDDDALLERLKHTVSVEPENDNARFDYVKLLLQLSRYDEAKTAFAAVKDKTLAVRKYDSLQRWMDAIDKESQQGADMTALDAAIATNKRDFAARHARAEALFAQERFTEAMDELLEILMRDKTWNEDQARKTYIAILDIFEPPHMPVGDGQIPPEDPTVATYRRRLSSVVLS
ncbi:MAG: thioredoxin [Brachymonas sp.]|nr:thioredoxin [Brachymonas sp.]